MATPSTAPMELDFNACQTSDCGGLEITDTTGLYSSGNAGGYGNPNFAISDAIDARIYVTDPSGVISIVNVFPTLPDSAGTSTYTILPSDLGLGSLADGIYVLRYQVDFNNISSQTVQYEVTKTLLLSCNIKCCIDQLVAKIPTSDCDCEDQALKTALMANGLYMALLKAGGCGNTSAVTNLLETLQRICDSTDCGCS
jgi:hypothetical protein